MDKPVTVPVPYDMARRLRQEWNPDRIDYGLFTLKQLHNNWIHAQGAKYVYSTDKDNAIYLLEFNDPKKATEFVLKYV